MKNTFIVSVDNGAYEIKAEDLRTTLCKNWGGYGGVKFSVEEGDHKTIAGFVSDYLTAEDALSKYEAEHDVYGGKTDLLTTLRWNRLYDDVQKKRTFLVSKLREYGCVV